MSNTVDPYEGKEPEHRSAAGEVSHHLFEFLSYVAFFGLMGWICYLVYLSCCQH